MQLLMPVRSLNSSVLKWPDKAEVDRAVRLWSAEQKKRRFDIVRLGYFGSYARGDWGVGSDLDLIAVVEKTNIPFERRSVNWRLESLPVASEIITYTIDEWDHLQNEDSRFVRMLNTEVVWIFERIHTHPE
jgi:predicted nucleotidyltransferase